MIKIFLIIAISCLFFFCNASQKKNTNNTLQKDSAGITRIEQLKAAFVQKDYTKFYRLFPDTYSQLLEFYGFDDSTGEKPLYFEAKYHIPFLFSQPEGFLMPLIKKAINISINAKWQADAVSYFQDELANLIVEKPKEFAEILNTKPDKEAASFWHFVFDGSGNYDLQNKEKFEIIYKKINSIDKKQGRLLKEEFERMYIIKVP